MGKVSRAAPVTDTEVTMVRMLVTQINVDPTQFKPYSQTLVPAKTLIVMVPVDKDQVTDDPLETTVTLQGFTALLKNIANDIDAMHHDRQLSVQSTFNRR